MRVVEPMNIPTSHAKKSALRSVRVGLDWGLS